MHLYIYDDLENQETSLAIELKEIVFLVYRFRITLVMRADWDKAKNDPPPTEIFKRIF